MGPKKQRVMVAKVTMLKQGEVKESVASGKEVMLQLELEVNAELRKKRHRDIIQLDQI